MTDPGSPAVFQAANRQQGYNTVFRREGIEITPTSAPAPWRLGLSVTGYGYDDDVDPVEAADPDGRNERIEYRRGALTEWYVNRPGGLEQGFELREPPPRQGRRLVIAMAVRGGLETRAGPGDAVSFVAPSGETLIRYADVKSWDAAMRPLRTRVVAGDRALRLVVDAQRARFPVTVDPVFVHEAQVFGHGDPTPPADAEFGSSVSVSGDTVVVGSPLDNTSGGLEAGSAYVFVRSGATWTEQQRLLAPDGAAGDWFGSSVSVSGDTVLVSAPLRDGPAGNDAGAVYVFVRSGTTWTHQQKLVASDGLANDRFGHAVSVSGDSLVAGAPFNGFSAGAAYVFVRSGTTWAQQQKLVAADFAVFDRFGFSVSLSADTVVAGAIFGDSPAGNDVGTAYVFVRSGTTWTQQQELVAPDGAGGDTFGYSVSVSADTALVGVPFDDNAGGTDAGSAYVFVRAGTNWTQQQKVLASDGAAADALGISVSLFGDTAVLGASGDDLPGAGDAGSAYVFARSGGTWSEQQKLIAPDGATDDLLGYSVSLSGDTVVAGARRDDFPAAVNAGSAYVFVRSGVSWSVEQKLLASVSGAAFDTFGGSVSISGDTVVIGAPRDDTQSGTNAGSAYVFVRAGAAWSEQQKLLPPAGAPGDFFGTSLSVSGDTVAITGGGSAYVFVRSGTTWTLQQEIVPPPGTVFRDSVSLSADTVVLGVPGDATSTGAAHVYARSGTVWTLQQVLVASDGAAGDAFGTSVSLSGDTAVVGAPLDTNAGGVQAGSGYVFVRSGTAWSEQQKLLASDGAAFDRLGFSAAVSGDTAVVGAYTEDNPGGPDAGSAYVFVRSGTTWLQQQKLQASDGAAFDYFGRAVALAGETAVVGADFDDTPSGLESGSAYVFVRSGTLWSQQQKLLAPDGAASDLFGSSASLSGDAVVIGSPSDDTPADGPDAGSAHIFRLQLLSDLAVTKTDGQTAAVPGLALTYTITVANAGPDAVNGAAVMDVVPAALLGASWTCVASAGSSCTPSGSGNINDVVSLLGGGTATYTMTGTVDPAATGSLVNTATVSAPVGTSDPNPANNSATDTDTLTPQADLAVTKTASVDPVAPGHPLTYDLTVTNAGPSHATSVTLVDSLPGGVTFVSSIPGPPTCTFSGTAVTCGLGTLAAGGNAAVTIDVIVNAATGTLVNTGTVAGIAADPDPANNSASAATTVRSGKGELGHGADAVHDLAAQPGPLADLDVFLIGQKPYSSYEVVVDGTSGDIGTGAGPLVQRIGADGTTVLQDSASVGTGSSRSLRFRNTTASEVNDQTIRVRSAGCGTDCGPDDVYRIRAYETTYSVARFNNAGSQLTVLVIQNPTDYTISGDVYFQETSGTLVATEPFTLAPKQTLVLNTATVPGAGGVGGAITIAHDGRYGDLAGKTVALEPAAGFSFDSALEARPE